MKIFKSKIFLCALALTLVCCIIMGVSYAIGGPTPITNALGVVLTPLQKGLSKLGDGISSFFGYFYKYSSMKEENARLKDELARYQKLEMEYNHAVKENVDLRRLTGLLKRHSDFDCELANVVSVVSHGFESGFSIDRGSVSGIENGDCVVTEQGLVGYVTDVGLTFARVETVLNLGFKAGAFNSRTREAAVAEGSFELAGDGQLRLSYIRNDADVRRGDIIQTSGEGGIYPKGIAIGRVADFQIESHGISSYAIINPVVEIDKLTAVFVVKDFKVTD